MRQGTIQSTVGQDLSFFMGIDRHAKVTIADVMAYVNVVKSRKSEFVIFSTIART